QDGPYPLVQRRGAATRLDLHRVPRTEGRLPGQRLERILHRHELTLAHEGPQSTIRSPPRLFQAARRLRAGGRLDPDGRDVHRQLHVQEGSVDEQMIRIDPVHGVDRIRLPNHSDNRVAFARGQVPVVNLEWEVVGARPRTESIPRVPDPGQALAV